MEDGGPRRVLVAGAGGFIGHHLVKRLKAAGHWVRGADIKNPQFESSPADEFVLGDLRSFRVARRVTNGVQDVYQLAADMGGIGYISGSHASISRNNILINSNLLEASRPRQIERYLFASSACVYPSFLQDRDEPTPLREEDAIPADPEKGYGWEKLFAEQLTTYYQEDYGLDSRIVRFHNIYGPLGTYEGGREKAPAAICRKVAEADDGSTIEVWGDGGQTRSYCYVKDCVEGIVRIMNSVYREPLNLGTDEAITVDGLVAMVSDAAGKDLTLRHDTTKPHGVRGRNSDNSRLREILGWEPETRLREGLGITYSWIWDQLRRERRAKPPAPGAHVARAAVDARVLARR